MRTSHVVEHYQLAMVPKDRDHLLTIGRDVLAANKRGEFGLGEDEIEFLEELVTNLEN